LSRLLLAVWLAVAATGAPELRQPRASEQPPDWLIYNVLRWLPLVERWHSEFDHIDPALILGIIAIESQGDPYAVGVDGAGSYGLCQIIARSWTGTPDQLKRPEYNLFVCMRMMSAILDKTDGDVRMALAWFNCGEEKVANDACGTHGGYSYADRVLGYFVPVFQAELVVLAADNEWLAELGYLYGTGRWDRVEYPFYEKCVVSSTGSKLCML